jgi:hypothetical protein
VVKQHAETATCGKQSTYPLIDITTQKFYTFLRGLLKSLCHWYVVSPLRSEQLCLSNTLQEIKQKRSNGRILIQQSILCGTDMPQGRNYKLTITETVIFEILTAVKMLTVIFGVLISCNLVCGYQHVG